MNGGLYVCHHCKTATFSSLSSKISHLEEAHHELYDGTQPQQAIRVLSLQALQAPQNQNRPPYDEAPETLYPEAS
jgi:hypothetical protein